MGLGEVIRAILAVGALVLGTIVLIPATRRRYFGNVYRTSRHSRRRIVRAWRAFTHTWPFEGTVLVLFGAGSLVRTFSFWVSFPDPVLEVALWARTLAGFALLILFAEASAQRPELPRVNEDRERPG